MTGTEAVAVVALLAVALAAPIALLVRHVKQTAWDDTARVIELGRRLRWPVILGLAAYGAASLLVRVIESVLLRRAAGVAWPVWDLVMVLFLGAGVAGTWMFTRPASGGGSDPGVQ